MFILFFYFNIIKPYREIKARDLIYFNNPFLHFYNK